MVVERHADEVTVVDEGAWIYLIAAGAGSGSANSLRESIIRTCEEGGWPAISWPPVGADRPSDPGHLFEGVRHAVEHADCVVALLEDGNEMMDVELALAYSHRRPVVGMRADSGLPASGVQAMLATYERGRVIACDDVDECAAQLRAVLDDPDFATTIRRASGEHAVSA